MQKYIQSMIIPHVKYVFLAHCCVAPFNVV